MATRNVDVLNAKVNVEFSPDAALDDIKEFSKVLDRLVKTLSTTGVNMNKLADATKKLESSAGFDSMKKLEVVIKSTAGNVKLLTNENKKLQFSIDGVQKSTKKSLISLSEYKTQLANISKTTMTEADYKKSVSDLQSRLSMYDLDQLKSEKALQIQIEKAHQAAIIEDIKRSNNIKLAEQREADRIAAEEQKKAAKLAEEIEKAHGQAIEEEKRRQRKESAAAAKAAEKERLAAMADIQKEYNNAVKAEAAEIDKQNGLDRFSARSAAINDDFINFSRGIKQFSSDFKDSMAIISGGGSKIVALRNIFTNVGDTTSRTARFFDILSERADNAAGKALPRLERALKNTTSEALSVSQALQHMSDDLTNINNIDLLDKSAGKSITRLKSDLSNTSKEITTLLRVVETTGTASRAQIDRVSSNLTRVKNNLSINETALLSLGDEGKRVYDSIARGIDVELNLLKLVEAQSRSFNKEQERISTLARETGVSFEEAARKSNSWLTSLKNLFRIGSTGTAQLNENLKKTNSTIKQTSALTSGLSMTMMSLTGGILGGGLAFAIPSIFTLLQNKLTGAVQAASDANEEMSKFAVVFDSEVDPAVGESDALVQHMIEVVDGLAEKLGRSKYELRAFAAQFQDTFVPLGFAREEAAKLSFGLVELTQNLSSFYNMSEKETADRISSFLVGNYENARAFGVIVNDASLNAELLKMGIEGGTRAVDQQVKSLVALKILYSGTADAEDDVVRTSAQFANMMRELQGAARDAAVELGSKLLPIINPILATFIRIKGEIGPYISDMFNRMYEAVLPLSEAFVDVITKADDLSKLGDIANYALSVLMDTLNSFLPVAYNWAWAWGVEIYNGLIDVAVNLISEAAAFIGSIISSFLEPGSPPEKGPLSTIDKWGVGLMETFAGGFADSKVDLLTSILGPVADAMQGSGKSKEFAEIKNGFADIIEQATSTGEFDSKKLDSLISVSGVSGEEAEAIKKQIEEKAKLIRLQQQLADAQEAGDGAAVFELKKQIKEQQSVVSEVDSRISAQERLLQLEERVAEKRKDAASAAGALAPAMAAASDAAEKYRKTAQEIYQEELDNAEEIYNEKMALASTEEEQAEARKEYLAAQLSAEKKYYKVTEGEVKSASAKRVALLSSEIDTLDERLKELRKSDSGGTGAGGKLGLADIGLSVEDILPPKLVAEFEQRNKEAFAKASENIVGSVMDRVYTKIDEEQVPLSEKITGTFSKAFTDLKTNVQTMSPEDILPFSIVTGAAIAGLIALLTPLGGLLAAAATTFMSFLVPVTIFVGTGYVVYNILANWDSILARLTETFGGLKEPLETLKNNVKLFIDGFTTTTVDDGFGNMLSVDRIDIFLTKLNEIKTNISGLFNDIVNNTSSSGIGDFLGGLVTKFNEFIEKIGGAKAIGDSFGEAIENLLTSVNNLIIRARGLVTGDAPFSPSGPLGAFLDLLISLKNTFVDAFYNIATNSTIFSQIFESLKQSATLLVPIIGAILIVLGILGGVIINVLLAAFQALGAVIPFIVGAFNGALIAINGFLMVLNSLGLFIAAIVQFILGIFTGDFSTAWEHLNNAFTMFYTGILSMVTGLLDVIINLGAGILVAIETFIISFIANIVSLFGPDAEEYANAIRGWAATFTNIVYSLVNSVEVTLSQIPLIFSTYVVDNFNKMATEIGTWPARLKTTLWQVYFIFLYAFSAAYDAVIEAKDNIATTIEQLQVIFQSMVDNVNNTVAGWVNDFLQYFYDLYDELVGHSVIPDTVTEIVAWIASLGPSLLAELAIMTTDLIAGFLQLGKDMLTGLINGLGDGSLVSQALGFIKGLFSGEETTTDVAATDATDVSTFTGSVGNMTTSFNTFINTIKTEITNTGLLWNTFANNMYLYLITNFTNLAEPIETFFLNLGDKILTVTNYVMSLTAEFLNYGENITTINENTKSGFNDNISALEDLETIVKKVTKAYEKMADAAKKAINNANNAIGSSGLTPQDSYAKGTDYVPKTGIYTLHKGEAVVTAYEAKQLRALLANMNNVNSSSRLNSISKSLSSTNSSNVTNTKTANININANYQEVQAPTKIRDDVFTALRLSGIGV